MGIPVGNKQDFRDFRKECPMKHMPVRHKVADFDVWKKFFDSHADAQKDEPDCWYLD